MVKAIKLGGYHVFSTKEYMSRVRGGQNSTQIRASSQRVRSYVDRIDLLVALSEEAILHLEDRISPETVIICDDTLLKEVDMDKYHVIRVPFLEKAREGSYIPMSLPPEPFPAFWELKKVPLMNVLKPCLPARVRRF
jgi:2-oxoglutarate ferredoxin oxidoreductase subunit alpha